MLPEEIRAVRVRALPCLSLPQPPARLAEMMVEIELNFTLPRPARPSAVKIVGVAPGFSLQEGHYRRFVRAVVESLRDPACQPLPLEAGRFDAWRVMRFWVPGTDVLAARRR